MTEPKKTKVLRIISRLNIGGPAIHVTNLNYYLDKEGFSSTLVYGSLADGEGSMEYLARDKHLKTILIPELGREISLFKDLLTIWKLYKLIRQEKPDIVHTHTAKAGTVGRTAAWLAGVKKIYHTFHGHVFHSYFSPFKTRVFIVIERLLALISTRIIAISEKQKAELLDYKITTSEKLTVIPLGFELSKFLKNQNPNYWHHKYSLAAEIKLIGIVGRLVPVKNHFYFLEIAEKVLRQRPDIKFLIIGDGELRTELEKTVNYKSLQADILFTGFEIDPVKIYGDLSIVALTSKNEGTPVTLIEALACGKPVITTDVGGIGDIIKHQETGYLEAQNDPAAFATDLLFMLDNPAKTQNIALNGQRQVFLKYDVGRLTKDIKDLYLK